MATLGYKGCETKLMVCNSKMIIFYDFASKKSIPAPWNPNTWKTRYSLNYKALPYKTIWLEYPDVESTLIAAGVPPSGIRNGTPLYTLPAIVDQATGTALSDSFLIAEYLDQKYPGNGSNTAPLLPKGTRALQAAFLEVTPNTGNPGLFSIVRFTMQKVAENILDPRSEAYCRAVWESILGVPLNSEGFFPKEDAQNRMQEWKHFEECMRKIDNWIGKESRFVTGDEVSFADFGLAGILQCYKEAWGEDSSEWQKLMMMQEGRWGKLLEDLREYEGHH